MLLDRTGWTLIQHVHDRCLQVPGVSRVVVATDGAEIGAAVKSFGGEVIETSPELPSGTDRVAAACERLGLSDDHHIVNVQGDEPFINPEQINQITSLFNSEKVSIATLAKKIEDEVLITDENSPKAIFDENGIALNFCRIPPKYSTGKDYFKHIGIYGYLTETLAEICKLPPSENELKERLEQLRWLDNNYRIKVGITTYEGVSIDTPEDIKKIKAEMG